MNKQNKLNRRRFLAGSSLLASARAATPNMDKIEWMTMADMMGAMDGGGYKATYAKTEYDYKTAMRVDNPRINLDDVGVNLRDVSKTRKVLTYSQLHTIEDGVIAEQRLILSIPRLGLIYIPMVKFVSILRRRTNGD